MVFILRRLRRSYAQLRRNLATARNCAAVVKKVATWASTSIIHSNLERYALKTSKQKR